MVPAFDEGYDDWSRIRDLESECASLRRSLQQASDLLREKQKIIEELKSQISGTTYGSEFGGYYGCAECDAGWNRLTPPKFCPECGRRVVKKKEEDSDGTS